MDLVVAFRGVELAGVVSAGSELSFVIILGKCASIRISGRVSFDHSLSFRVERDENWLCNKEIFKNLKGSVGYIALYKAYILPGKVSQGLYDIRIVVNKLSIEVGEPKELLDFLGCSRGLSFLYSFNLLRVYSYTCSCFDNKPKVLRTLHFEFGLVNIHL
jgi:hypothetical protein